MEIAVLLAAGLRDWIDFGVIIGILLLNAVVGWYQEKQAADVVASLKGDIAMKSIVVREGQEQEIRARELVPGDIVSWIPLHSADPTPNLTRLDFLRNDPPDHHQLQFTDHFLRNRSLSKMVLLSPQTAASSVPTTIPTVTQNTSRSSPLRLVTLQERRMMMMRNTARSMVLDTLSWPSINPP